MTQTARARHIAFDFRATIKHVTSCLSYKYLEDLQKALQTLGRSTRQPNRMSAQGLSALPGMGKAGSRKLLQRHRYCVVGTGCPSSPSGMQAQARHKTKFWRKRWPRL
ncbi:protein of unknown function (plasmid) [Caballeronia sp. S22]